MAKKKKKVTKDGDFSDENQFSAGGLALKMSVVLVLSVALRIVKYLIVRALCDEGQVYFTYLLIYNQL